MNDCGANQKDISPLSIIDCDVAIDELISARELERLLGLVEEVLGRPVRLFGSRGNLLTGKSIDAAEGATRLPVSLDFEPLAYLEANCSAERLIPIARMLEWSLQKQLQYRLVSSLHSEIVAADYAELQKRNAALQESEARYKSLSKQLEERVQEQLETIKKAERQLYEQDRLAAVGQLAAGVAHELNTPLSFITTNLDAARDYIAELKTFAQPLLEQNPNPEVTFMFEDFNSLIKESMEGCEHASNIIKSLRDFAVVDADGEVEVDFNELVRSVCQLYQGERAHRIEFVLDLPLLPPLRCISSHIKEVIANLLSNAIDALNERKRNDAPTPKIEISTRQESTEILLNIKDNGPGIPEQQLKQIFVPFFTTKEVGRGTGLGLTRCRDIIRSHGGEISITNDGERGTLASIRLPALVSA